MFNLEIGELIYLVLALFALGLFAYYVYDSYKLKRKNDRAEIISKPAILINKYSGVDRTKNNSGKSTEVRRKLTFKFADESELTFNVSLITYSSYSVDDQGVLTYQGTKFLEFK